MVTKRGYVVAALIALLGTVVGVIGLVRGFNQLSDEVESFSRVDVPGSTTLPFEAGELTVYLEGQGPVTLLVRQQPGGQPVPIEEYGGSFEYSVGGHDGTAVATFTIATSGSYLVTTEADFQAGLSTVAIGESLGDELAQTLVPGLLMGAALLTAAIVVIVTFVRRRRQRQRATSAPGQGHGGQGPPDPVAGEGVLERLPDPGAHGPTG